jgi:hypothetical protein
MTIAVNVGVWREGVVDLSNDSVLGESQIRGAGWERPTVRIGIRRTIGVGQRTLRVICGCFRRSFAPLFFLARFSL